MSSSRPSAAVTRAYHQALGLGAGLGILIPLLLGIALAHHTLTDLDIWLHDRAGQQIRAGEGVPRTNSYSFTAPEHTWVDHEWLFQVVVSASGASTEGQLVAGSWNLLRILLTATLLLVLLLGDGVRGRIRWHRSTPCGTIYLALPAVATLGLLWPRLILRPELISYICFVLTLRWIDRATYLPPHTTTPTRAPSPAGRSGLALLAPWDLRGKTVWLALLWAQFHGFYVLVPALWLLAGLLAPLDRRLQRLGTSKAPWSLAGMSFAWAGWMLAAFLVGLATPNGLPGLLYPFRALGQFGATGIDLREIISELAPLLSTTDALGTTIQVFRLSVIWAAVWLFATAGRVSLLRVVVWALTLVAVLNSQRNLGFYALSFFLIHSGYRPDRLWWWSLTKWPPLFKEWAAKLVSPLRLVPWLALTAALLLALSWYVSLRTDRFYLAEGVARRYGSGLTPAQYPVRTVSALSRLAMKPSPRVVNNVDCAALLVHQRGGQVYIDGRTEAYPPAIWREYGELKKGGSHALHLLQRRQADAVLLAHRGSASHSLLTTLLDSSHWRVAHVDEAGILFLPASPDTDALDTEEAEVWRDAVERLLSSLPAAGVGDVLAPAGRDVIAADRCVALAGILDLAGRHHEAETLLRRGLRYCADHPILNHNYGNVLLARRAYQEALAHFLRALATNDRPAETYVNTGICLFHLGDLERAERAFVTATRREAGRSEAWVNLAEVRRRRGDRAGALAAYYRALTLLPRDERLRQRVNSYQAGRSD